MSNEVEVPYNITPEEAREILWKKGNLQWKLDANQKDIYSLFKSNDEKITVVAASRRLGKSYLLLILAIEQCLQVPKSIVLYITPEQKMAKKIIKPLMDEIVRDCPEELRPIFKTNDALYLFPNGSEIRIAGTDGGRHESMRGGNANIAIVDEAGFCDELNYVIKSVLIPMTTNTRGKILLSSTPPKSTDHEFVKYLKEAEFKDKLIKKTIYDNPRLTKEMIAEIVAEYEIEGGAQSADFRREYLCELIADENSSVIPEFTDTIQKEIVQVWERPPYYHAYTSMDIGFQDLTVVLFAYYDFKNDKVVIEDELVLNGKKMTTDVLAAQIFEKEQSLWINKYTREVYKPYLRISDNNLILLNDLQTLHNLSFIPTAKDNSEGAINNIRIKIAQRKVIINPRCITLIKHLKGATWNKARTSYERSPDDGHYDAIDALKYLLRNIQYTRNPYPAHYGVSSGEEMFSYHKQSSETPLQSTVKQMLGVRRFNK